jgi:hypothetical protein
MLVITKKNLPSCGNTGNLSKSLTALLCYVDLFSFGSVSLTNKTDSVWNGRKRSAPGSGPSTSVAPLSSLTSVQSRCQDLAAALASTCCDSRRRNQS